MPFDIGNFNLDVKALQTRAKGGIVTDGLVLHLDAAYKNSYSGGGTTWYDLSGNGNHGTMVNGPTFNSDSIGIINFDGSNDYVNLNTNISFTKTGQFSISLWVKFADHSNKAAAAAGIFGKGHYYNNTWAIWLYNDHRIAFETSGNSSSGQGYNLSGTLTPNTWYHYTATYNNGSKKSYINGINIANETYTGTGDFNNNNPVLIGQRYNDSSRSLNGSVSMVQLYNKGLSPDEVWQNYENTKNRFTWEQPSIITDGLVLHLDAGDAASYPGSGTTWYDISGNGYNGTLFGSPSFTTSPSYFDITSDSTYVRLNSYSHRTNDFTYSMWVNFDAFDTYDTLFENGSWSDTLLLRVQSTTSIAVYIENGLRGTFTWNPSINTWYNIVYTRSGSTNTLYVNGVQSGSTFTNQTDINIANAYTFLMRSQHATSQFTNGKIAYYSMYNKALSSTEITQNYNALKGRFGL